MKKHNFLSEKKQLKIKIIRCSAIVVAVVVVLVSLLLVLKAIEKSENQQSDSGLSPEVAEQIKIFDGKEYIKKNRLDTVLVMGLDEVSSDIKNEEDAATNNQEADFLMLLVFDNDNSTFSAFHINRDTMVTMDTLSYGDTVSAKKQIALAHTYGNGGIESGANTVKALKGLLEDVDIDCFVSVPMDSVAEINDIVGGVEVTVLQDLSEYDPELVENATVRLKDKQALTYVRTRYGLDDSSNKTRMERQKQYVNALFDTFTEAAYEDEEALFNKLQASNTAATMTANNANYIVNLMKRIPDYKFSGIYTLEGEYKTIENSSGEINMEFTPFDDSIDKVLTTLFYEPYKK